MNSSRQINDRGFLFCIWTERETQSKRNTRGQSALSRRPRFSPLQFNLNNKLHWSAAGAQKSPFSQWRKVPRQLGVESLLEPFSAPAKLAWTCSSTHPNRWAQSIPLSSTSSEAARPFVLTIHKRPFKWRDSVISEILASGLCRIEKREGERKRGT